MDEMTREVELDCDIDRAWHAISDETELEQWLGGEVEADLRPGGEITVTGEDGDVREGFVETVDPGRELTFWWSAGNESESSRVELELLPTVEGDGCVIRVTESRPLVELERELVEITGGTAGEGPVAAASFALV